MHVLLATPYMAVHMRAHSLCCFTTRTTACRSLAVTSLAPGNRSAYHADKFSHNYSALVSILADTSWIKLPEELILVVASFSRPTHQNVKRILQGVQAEKSSVSSDINYHQGKIGPWGYIHPKVPSTGVQSLCQH